MDTHSSRSVSKDINDANVNNTHDKNRKCEKEKSMYIQKTIIMELSLFYQKHITIKSRPFNK